MSTPTATPEAPAPFRRPISVAELNREAKTKFKVAAEPGELVELARYLGVDQVGKLTLTGFISAAGDTGWRIHGRLVASVEQRCIVSLVPLNTKFNQQVERDYLPESQITPQQEVLVSHDDEDLPDPFSDTLDPALLAVDELLQVIDPYPKAKGVELGQSRFAAPGIRPLTDEASRPFAGLAVLKPGADDGET